MFQRNFFYLIFHAVAMWVALTLCKYMSGGVGFGTCNFVNAFIYPLTSVDEHADLPVLVGWEECWVGTTR